MKQQIRNFNGQIIGSIEDSYNGDLIARDFHGNILGRYDKHCDVTRDFHGNIICKGNQVGMLIGMNNK